MDISLSTLIKLIFFMFLPVLASVGFYLFNKKSPFFNQLNYWPKQIIIGIVFGGLAVIATEFGIAIPGAVINVRDAAPICAGLIFGGPAGIIAGLIGGIERWFCVLWGGGAYTRIACTIATILAGIITALIRHFMFDDKRPTWPYGLFLALEIEVIHMLMVFFTNMNDIRTAFGVVEICSAPMIICNCLSVTLAIMAVSLLNKESLRKKVATKQITSIFALWLLAEIIVAFLLTCFFVFALQNNAAKRSAEDTLQANIDNIREDIEDWADTQLITLAQTAAVAIDTQGVKGNSGLDEIRQQYDGIISEICVVNEEGFITLATDRQVIGYDMASQAQSAEFLCLLKGETTYAQESQARGFDGSKIKYVGVALEQGGFLQVGCDPACLQNLLDVRIAEIAKYRTVDANGYMIVADKNNIIVSDSKQHTGDPLSRLGITIPVDQKENEMFSLEIEGETCYLMYSKAEDFTVIAVMPETDVTFMRNLTVYLTGFLEVIVFFSLFMVIYFLIKRLIIDNIHAINRSLGKITRGHLDEAVSVSGNEEFVSLSEDINATVATLKRYISEAEERIKKELEVATIIQTSSLPSEFPPFPERNEFDIFATMTPAKEVGGDFYDFYFVDENRLAFLIADVSGKGITGAMFMMKAKAVLKGESEIYDDVEDILANTNEALCEGNDAEMFVTCWMGILDFDDHILTYCSAGHNPPLVRKKDGQFTYLSGRPNFVLGGLETVRYKQHEMPLEPGDEILLYTDGVTEATDMQNALYGEDRLLQAVNGMENPSCEALCDGIKADIDAFVGEAPQFDDITLLSLKVMR